jgi:hypothetical protein
MSISIPLVDTIVKVPLKAAIKTIDPDAPIKDDTPNDEEAVVNKPSIVVALMHRTVALPKQICTRVLVFISNTPGTGDVYKIICETFMQSTKDGESPYQLHIGPGYFDAGTGDSTVAITLQYRGSDHIVPPLIARRVHSNMHYAVDLRPFEAVVQLQQAQQASKPLARTPVLADGQGHLANAQGGPLGQAYTPLSFPPSPDARKRVLASHSRRAQDILCGARDKLCEEKKFMLEGR